MPEAYVSKDQFDEFVKRMEAGFHAMDQRFVDLHQALDYRFAAMDERFRTIDQRFDALYQVLDTRFAAVDRRFDGMDERFTDMNHRVTDLRQDLTGRVDSLDRRLLSVENWIRVTFVTVGVMVLGFVAQLVFLILRFGLSGPVPPTP